MHELQATVNCSDVTRGLVGVHFDDRRVDVAEHFVLDVVLRLPQGLVFSYFLGPFNKSNGWYRGTIS